MNRYIRLAAAAAASLIALAGAARAEPGREFPDDLMPEEDVTLSQALGARKTFKYLYDFGD